MDRGLATTSTLLSYPEATEETPYTDRLDPLFFSSIQPRLLVRASASSLSPSCSNQAASSDPARSIREPHSSGHSDWLCDSHMIQAKPMEMSCATLVLTMGKWAVSGERQAGRTDVEAVDRHPGHLPRGEPA